MWYYPTKKGTVSIIEKNRRFHVMYENESLGSYSSPQQAADDVSGGHTFTPSNGVDFAELNIPYDLSEWRRNSPK